MINYRDTMRRTLRPGFRRSAPNSFSKLYSEVGCSADKASSKAGSVIATEPSGPTTPIKTGVLTASSGALCDETPRHACFARREFGLPARYFEQLGKERHLRAGRARLCEILEPTLRAPCLIVSARDST